MDFNSKFEDEILAQCVRDVSFLKEASQICEAHHFCTKERTWLWKVIHDNWTNYREITTFKIVKIRAKHEFDKEKIQPYLAQAKKVFQITPNNPKTVLAELDKFVKFVNIQLALEETATQLEKNCVDDAEKTLHRRIRDISKRKKYTHINWIEGFEDRQNKRKYEKEHPDQFTTIPFGFPTLDKTLNGGGRKGELGLILSTTGQGKSVMLNNIVMSCIQRGHKAIYLAFEMPAIQIASRQDARWSGLKYSKFKNYDFKPSELRVLQRRLRKASKTFNNSLHIISFPVKSATIIDVKNAIEDIEQEYGFKADALYFDSLDHLKPLQGYGGNYRLQQSEVYWYAKGLAEEEGVFIVSSTQAGREWVKKIITSEASSEAYEKSRIADLIISLNDPSEFGKSGRKTIISDDEYEDDEVDEEIEDPVISSESKLMQMYLSKYRDGESRYKIDLNCDFTRMTMKEISGN